MASFRNHRIIIAALFLPHTAVLGPEPTDDFDDPFLSTGYTSEDEGATTPSEAESRPENILEAGVKPDVILTPANTGSGSTTSIPLSIVDDLKDRAAAGRDRPRLTKTGNSLLGRAVAAPNPRTPASEAANPFLASLSVPALSIKPSSVNPSPLSHSSVSEKSNESIPSPSTPSRSSTVAHAAALKRSMSRARQRSRTMMASKSRSSSRTARHMPSASSASIASLASTGSFASLDSFDSRLEEEVEEGSEEFHIAPNQHVNGGLKNAIDSVSAAMMHGLAPTSAPPTKSTFPSHISGTGHRKSASWASVSGQSREFDRLWVGCLGTKTDDWCTKLRERVEEALPKQEGGSEVPVWVKDSDFEGCYDEFCHQVLWPALHYAVPDAPKTRLFYESASYKQYVSVNWEFARRIGEVWKEGDIVWINDYHLMLVPLMLRTSGLIPSTAPIGFFLHIAFPSSEIFRCLSVREHLLKGILGADLVGFQTANYARHFRQTCGRVLGVETLPSGIVIVDEDADGSDEHSAFNPERKAKVKVGRDGIKDSGSGSEDELHPNDPGYVRRAPKKSVTAGRLDGLGKGRLVDVGVFPMGIDVARLYERRQELEVADWIAMLKEKYRGMKLIVGREKLDDIQGVHQKLQAFDVFLSKHPEWVGKVVLIQLAIPNSPSPSTTSHSSTIPSTSEDSGDITSAIISTVAHINSRFSTLTYQPIVMLNMQDVDFSQYLALLSVADVFLISSLREGMALRSHEFVCCQSGRADDSVEKAAQDLVEGAEEDKKGVLVLSEFTGSYSYSGFRSCIAINPWDARGTADAINSAITMSKDEAGTRWEELHSHVVTQTAQAFVVGFLTRCLRANGEHIFHKHLGSTGDARVLDQKAVLERWNSHNQGRKLILVDWEGTLVGDYLPAGAPGATPQREEQKEEEFKAAIEVLKKLVNNEENNEVWLLSGLPIKLLDRISKEIGGRIGIVAENGCFLKTIEPSVAGGTGTWITMVANFNMTWKNSCLEILNYFSERTPGSYIEEREASIVWRFWTGSSDDSADRQWARRQAAEAQNHIFDSLGERFGLRIIPGGNSFLVLPTKISRSTAVGAILHPDGPAQSPFAGARPWMAITESEVVPSAAKVSEKWDLILGVSSDENLLRRLAELSIAETCSTSGRGTDASWKMERSGVLPLLESIAAA